MFHLYENVVAKGNFEIGENCYLMAGAHIGHDCKIGRKVVMVNYSGLADHCLVGDSFRETVRSVNLCGPANPFSSRHNQVWSRTSFRSEWQSATPRG
jgi:UDP-3-O-[3-hydroxymyristoyl] glucosamine N-acyltransferase